MKHLDIQTALRLIRGQLEPAEGARWMTHVRQCPRCREMMLGEKAFATVMDLGARETTAVAPAIDELLARVPKFGARRSRFWLRPAVLLISESVMALLLTLLLWQQWSGEPPARHELASDFQISPQLQEQVLASTPALDVLERDPWLAENYEAVQALAQFLVERPAEP